MNANKKRIEVFESDERRIKIYFPRIDEMIEIVYIEEGNDRIIQFYTTNVVSILPRASNSFRLRFRGWFSRRKFRRGKTLKIKKVKPI